VFKTIGSLQGLFKLIMRITLLDNQGTATQECTIQFKLICEAQCMKPGNWDTAVSISSGSGRHVQSVTVPIAVGA
jgi:hypothetical protein